MKKTLLVFCHLRWNFVFQRPQHLLSRLAAHYDVVLVEEPVHAEGAPRLDREAVAPGVTVVRPRTPLASHGFQDDQLAAIGPLVADLVAARGAPYLVWFYTPMALPLLPLLEPEAVVYDCMDELSAFAGAPAPLRQREAALMAQADVVLTGGPSLYEARRGRHPHLLCLPSSVDARHFAPRHDDAAGAARARELQGAIGAPRLGYFGVVDERMDLALVARLADADPAWQIVMVGPVVKIDPASLPRRPNLHWLGQQPYELLPRLIEGWEIGLMPFALNESTRFISPTKTLEYMAAGKPVVSTAIQDVVTLYGDVVSVAQDPDAFVAACVRTLAADAPQRRQRAQAMQDRVASSSWDGAAETVRLALQQAQARRAARRTPLPADA